MQPRKEAVFQRGSAAAHLSPAFRLGIADACRQTARLTSRDTSKIPTGSPPLLSGWGTDRLNKARTKTSLWTAPADAWKSRGATSDTTSNAACGHVCRLFGRLTNVFRSQAHGTRVLHETLPAFSCLRPNLAECRTVGWRGRRINMLYKKLKTRFAQRC